MDDRATYQALHDYLFEDESAIEISFAEFQECFPKKYRKSAELKRLYKEVKKEQQEASSRGQFEEGVCVGAGPA